MRAGARPPRRLIAGPVSSLWSQLCHAGLVKVNARVRYFRLHSLHYRLIHYS